MMRWIALFAALVASTTVDAGQTNAEWFKSLKQPGSGVSCCDVSDCHRTQADWHDGGWWAVVEHRWTAIPAGKVLPQASRVGEAVVCNSAGYEFSDGTRGNATIYCFVPPLMGF